MLGLKVLFTHVYYKGVQGILDVMHGRQVGRECFRLNHSSEVDNKIAWNNGLHH